MKHLQFTQEIHATAEKIYKMMLGLDDKRTYEYWTAAFNPTSTYEGNWEIGSTMYFVGVDETGKKGGMVSKIEAHEPAKYVSIQHIGILDGEDEITSGELVESWAGGHENYTFSEKDGITTVTVDLDSVEEYAEYFEETYPIALEKLKEAVEK